MVAHWRKGSGTGARGKLILNAIGAAGTGITALVVGVAKFAEGAWITLAIIPLLLAVMIAVRLHYHRVAGEIDSPSALELDDLKPPLVVVPIEEWNRVAKKALRFALTLSPEIQALHIDSGDKTDTLAAQWREWVEEPARAAGRPPPNWSL